MSQKVYELSLVKDYVSSWGIVQAVRELLQNQLDSGKPFQCEYVNNSLIIKTENTSLSSQTLLLGATSKADDASKIGSFGEGYKIAILVLTRLLKTVVIFNGIKIWKPEFRKSQIFENSETLHIVEMHRYGMCNDLTFEIQNISLDEYEEIRKSCLHLWSSEEIGEVIHCERGRILKNLPGKLYVNGLFVCNTELRYGYDMRPQYLQLERDRQTVSSWDLKYQTTIMWVETGRFDEVIDMVSDSVQDVAYCEYHTHRKELVDAAFNHYSKSNAGKTAVTSQEEMNNFVKSGVASVAFVPPGMKSLLLASPAYQITSVIPSPKPPHEILEKWLEENIDHVNVTAVGTFNEIIEQSKKWLNP